MSLFLLALALFAQITLADTLVVASKTFTESHILAEIAALKLEYDGFQVERKLGLGGSLLVFNALETGDVDLYPDYSGTLAQSLLNNPNADQRRLNSALAQQKLKILAQLGFNNSYAMAMNRTQAEQLGLTRVSQLKDWPDLRVGVSLEFLNRNDGWQALQQHYKLPQNVSGLEHALAYPALAADQIDITDAYTTDGELNRYDLLLLEDDGAFFPEYQALYLGRDDLPDSVKESLAPLKNAIDESTMQALNAQVGDTDKTPRQIAGEFLAAANLVAVDSPVLKQTTRVVDNILANTLTHIRLTVTAMAAACLIAIPLGLFAAGRRKFSTSIIYLAGLLQTIPSLALLAFMIPLFGLGEVTAIIALFLYSLLPILRNTITGIQDVDPLLRQVAIGMGLTPAQRLKNIELPLAMPTLLAGVKTAAIISIGTATLAAFVGAGGLGEPIVTGLALNDHELILQGAIPAALLAIATEFLFECIERIFVPLQLRQAV